MLNMSFNRLRSYLYRHKTKCVFIAFMACCFGVTVYTLSRSGLSSLDQMQCSHTESEAMIKELCSLYSSGKVMGNMCHDMCDKGNIIFKRCLNYKGGKHVLLVDCIDSCDHGQTVQAVLKTTHTKDKDMHRHLRTMDKNLFEIFTYIKVFDQNVHPIDFLIDYKHLVHKIEEMLFNEYSYRPEEKEDLLGIVWGGDHMKFRESNGDDPAYPINFVRTLWSLLAQNEYKISVLFQKWNIFPKTYGFCGPLYLSEHAPFDQTLDRRLKKPESVLKDRNSKILWRQRASTAIHILDLVHSSDSLQTPLQFCDVKMPHFGTNFEGEIRFTDVDTVFTNDTLNSILETNSCMTDKDCAFFDCLGMCNVKSRKCSPYRINNNLQCVCARILQDNKENVYEGILSNPPPAVASKLKGLLNDCVNGVTEHKGNVAIKKPSHALLREMTNTLLDSLESD